MLGKLTNQKTAGHEISFPLTIPLEVLRRTLALRPALKKSITACSCLLSNCPGHSPRRKLTYWGLFTSDLFGVYLRIIEIGVRMRQKAAIAIIEGGRPSEQHVVVVHSEHRRWA